VAGGSVVVTRPRSSITVETIAGKRAVFPVSGGRGADDRRDVESSREERAAGAH